MSELVGREGELRVLREAMTHPPSVALVEGEPGIGKTRLVRAAAEGGVSGRTLLLGHCHQLREPFPYGPVFEALREVPGRLAGNNPVTGPLAGLNPVTGALRGHLPELGELLPPAPPPLADPAAERHRLFRAVRELLAAAGPAVLVIEDLHWADDGTRELLRFLTSRPPEGLALVLTYRRPVTGLPLGSASAVISLTPLDAAQVGRLASGLLQRRELPPGFADRLHRRTSGIPFLVEELLRSVGADLELGRVPLLLREAMTEQLDRLPPEVLATVRAAAVLRVPVREDELAAVAGGAAGLLEALRLGVLHEHPGGRYGFRHPLAQEAAYDTIPGPGRRLIHARAVAALAEADPPPLVQLTFHARRAGDLAAWLEYGKAAAARAAAVGDLPVAVEVLEELLADPELPEAERPPLVLTLGRLAMAGPANPRAILLLRPLLADERLSRELRGEARLSLGLMLHGQLGDVLAARPAIMAAVADLEAERPALAARGLACLAMPGWGPEPLEVQEQWMRRAEHLAAAGDDPELQAAVAGNRAALAMSVGRPEAGALAARLPAGDPSAAVRRQVARTLCNLYDLAVTLGRLSEAEEYGRRGTALAEETGALFPIYLVQGVSLRIDWMIGRWEGLAARAEAMVETTRDSPFAGVEARLVLGQLALAAGEWTEAESHLHAAGRDSPDSLYLPFVLASWAGLVELHLAREQVARAVEEARRAAARLRRKGVWAWGDQVVPAAVTALVTAGLRAEAATLMGDFEAGLAGLDAPSARAGLHVTRGLLTVPEEAYEHFARARETYDAIPQPYAAARAGESEAGALLALGKSTAAATVLAEVAERFAALGATRDAARCRRLLREHGVSAPALRRGGVLSQREREVARLVALGRTNKEIAEVLFLSRRTVETHVATLLRKLGVRSRTEITPPAD
ncbi:AAA family ATPase [Nonomuraea sp. NPDC050328]|uniref:helix-turn-helix transcriptional regulator n=1 Tax=Nonomuraea sp. NPDC050328 TaxID=3364361 RepID=UPI0037A8B683